MGRPEKSESRDLSPAVHTLFPIDEGRRRSALGERRGLPRRGDERPPGHRRRGNRPSALHRLRRGNVQARCPDCNGLTDAVYECPDCDREVDPDEAGIAECPSCETNAYPTQYTEIDIGEEFRDALESVGERETAFDIVKGVEGLMSAEKVPEPMEKGILRAKHDVTAFKDGTVRYDMTDLPVTAVRATELDVTVDQLQSLGYETDVHGDP